MTGQPKTINKTVMWSRFHGTGWRDRWDVTSLRQHSSCSVSSVRRMREDKWTVGLLGMTEHLRRPPQNTTDQRRPPQDCQENCRTHRRTQRSGSKTAEQHCMCIFRVNVRQISIARRLRPNYIQAYILMHLTSNSL